MKYSTDLSIVDWLKPTINTPRNAPILKVKDVLPDMFAAYIALLPAVGIIQDFPFDEIDLGDLSITQLNKNAAIWEQYGTHTIHRAPNYTPTTFKNLAAQFGLPYDLSMGRRLEWGKRGFASQFELTASKLAALLRILAADSQLVLYIEDYWRWEGPHNLLSNAGEVIYHVTIEEFSAFFKQAFFDATLYLFPTNRSWCLCNAEDGLCPIIGTTVEVAAAIKAESNLEILQLMWESEL